MSYNDFVTIAGCFLGLLIVVVLARTLRIRLRWILSIIINSLLGCALIYTVNTLSGPHFYIGINPFTAIFMGFLGIPGAFTLIILKLII